MVIFSLSWCFHQSCGYQFLFAIFSIAILSLFVSKLAYAMYQTGTAHQFPSSRCDGSLNKFPRGVFDRNGRHPVFLWFVALCEVCSDLYVAFVSFLLWFWLLVIVPIWSLLECPHLGILMFCPVWVIMHISFAYFYCCKLSSLIYFDCASVWSLRHNFCKICIFFSTSESVASRPPEPDFKFPSEAFRHHGWHIRPLWFVLWAFVW